MSNVATLTLKGTSDLKAIATDLKSVASESQKAGTNLKTATTELDKGAKSASSFGQKLKGFGSQFSSSIASIGTLGGTVLNLSRQYQDLGDSQIAVEKAQRRVSTANEAVTKAQTALNTAVTKYGAGSEQAKQASLDLDQANSQLSINTQLLTERTEDHQRAQENFWIGLVPTVTSAGGSIISVIKDIGGTKGLGGLKTAFAGLKGAFTGLGGIGGLASGLTGIGTAAGGSVTGLNGMAGATTGLGTAMKGLALSALPVALAIGGVALVAKQAGMVIHTIVSVMKGDMLEAVTTMEKTIALVEMVGPALGPFGGIQTSVFTALKPEIQKFKEELSKVPQVIKPISAELQALDNIGQGMNGTVDNLIGGVMGLVRHAEAAPAPINATGGAIAGVGTSASTATPQVTGLDTALDGLSGSFATIVSNVGPASTALGGLDAQMNPFNANLVVAAQNSAAESSELALLTKAAMAGAKASGSMSAEQNRLAATLAKATQNVNRQYQAVQKLGSAISHTGTYNIGGMMKGQNAGGGGHYVTFRGGKQIGGGPGTAPKFKKAATGMHEMVNQPTWILAGESGKERVDIDKPGKGGGGFSGIINVYVDGVLQRARYDINKFQGVMK